MPKQNTKPTDYPQAVIQQIELLAQNIVVARKRRKETQAQWASRLGVSQPTMARIEKGDPSVAMASYAMCMWLINPGASLAGLIAPQLDTMALEREVAKVRPRGSPVFAVGSSRKRNESSHPDVVESASVRTIVKTASAGIGSLAETEKFLKQQSVAEVVRNMGIGALTALEGQKVREQLSAIDAIRNSGLGALSALEAQRVREQTYLADAARNLGIGSLAETEKFLKQQSAAEIARNMGIGALTALEGQKVREQLSAIDAIRNSGLGALSALEDQRVREQLNMTEAVRKLGLGAVSQSELVAKVQEGNSK
jgi:DNA-binding XRE family transcriptional regulator